MAEYNEEYKFNNKRLAVRRRKVASVFVGIASVLLVGTLGVGLLRATVFSSGSAEAEVRQEQVDDTTSVDTIEDTAAADTVADTTLASDDTECQVYEAISLPAPEPVSRPSVELIAIAKTEEEKSNQEEVQKTEAEAHPETVSDVEVLSKENMSLNDYVSQKASPSVVAVKATDGYYIQWSSGVIISSDGLVVTNYHAVLPVRPYVTVFCNGKEYSAHTLGYNADCDVALLQVELGGDTVIPIEIADSNSVQEGDWVMCMGAPRNAQEYSCGNVTQLGHEVSLYDPSGVLFYYRDLIGSSAWSTYGYSGGALLDEDGRLVGMNAVIMDEGQGSDAWVESFAISSNLVSNIVSEILS